MEHPIDTSESKRTASSGRRLWYALGASGLLIAILAGVALWLHWHRQIRAVREIRPLCSSFIVDEFTPEWLRNLVGNQVADGFDTVTIVNLKYSSVTDAELVHLKSLTDLKELSLRENRVTDAGLANLKGLTNLEILDLSHTRVTDAGMVHLKSLTDLEELELHRTRVTDAGLVNLEGLINLRGHLGR